MKSSTHNLILVCFSLVSPMAHGAQTYQDSNALNTWNTSAANWDAGVIWTNTTTNDAIFAGTGESVTVTTVNARDITFDSSGYTLTGSTITLGGTSTITANQNAAIASILAGASTSLTKAGTGTLTMSAANTYTGSTIVNAGTLLVNPSGSLGGSSGITINNTGTLEFAGSTNSNGLGSGNKQITVNTGGTLKSTTSNSMGYSAQTNYANITMSGGTFTVNATQYINRLTISSGSAINGSSAIQSWQTSGDFIVANEDATISSGIRFNDNNATLNVAASKTLTVSGAVSNFSGNSQSSTTKYGFTKSGTGTLLLSGTNNFGGVTTVSAGTLKLGSASALGATSNGTSVTSGAVLDLNGQTIGAEAFTLNGTGISSAGALINSSSTAATLSGAVTLASASSVGGSGGLTLSGPISGSFGLTKVGAGTLTLSNASNAHASTTVSGGTLSIGAASHLGTGSLSFSSVGTGLTVTGTAVTLSNNISLPTSGTGNVTLLTPDSSSTTLSGTLSGGGSGTTFFLQGGAVGSSSGAITLSGNNTGLLGTLNVQRGPLILSNANAAGSTKIILDSNNNANGALQLNGNFVISNDVKINYLSQRIGVGSGLSAGISGVISENSANGLEKVGAGTLTLSNTNTYTGATLVSAGTLLISGELGNSAVSVANGATLTNNGTIGGTVTTGSTGTVNGTGTFSGATTINGTLSPGNSPGFQTYSSSLTLGSSSSTNFELGGLTRGTLLLTGLNTYDAINVGSTLTLDGTINVSWFGGFDASLGDSFNLFDWGTIDISGFNVENDLLLPTLASGLSWDTSSFTTNGAITVVPETGTALLASLSLLTLPVRRR